MRASCSWADPSNMHHGALAASGVNPLEHYLTFGIYEGRLDDMW